MAEDLQRRMAQIDETLAPAKRIVEGLGPVNASQLGVVLNCVRQTIANLLLPLPEIVEPPPEETHTPGGVLVPGQSAPQFTQEHLDARVEPEAPVAEPETPVAEVTPDP